MIRLAYDMAKDPNLRHFLETDFMLTLAHKMLTNSHTFHRCTKTRTHYYYRTILKIFQVSKKLTKHEKKYF